MIMNFASDNRRKELLERDPLLGSFHLTDCGRVFLHAQSGAGSTQWVSVLWCRQSRYYLLIENCNSLIALYVSKGILVHLGFEICFH